MPHGAVQGTTGVVKLGSDTTVSVPVPDNPDAEQVIVVVPDTTTVAIPVDALIVATPGALLVHPEETQAGAVLPAISRNSAENETVVPIGALAVKGLATIELAINI